MQEKSYHNNSESLAELYQEVILDHSKNPRCHGELDNYTSKAHGHNAMCGDKITLYLQVEDNIIKDISYVSSGCAISVASASLMSEQLKGRSLEEAENIFSNFHEMLTGNPVNNTNVELSSLGDLSILKGVNRFPTRIKCATLAWHALSDALSGALKN